jgi:hypothetical protein
MDISRRRLMISGAAFAAALSSWQNGVSALYGESDRELCRRLRRLSHLPSIRSDVGSAYLARYPAEAGSETLTRLILSHLSQRGCAGSISDDRSLCRAVADCLRDDFAEGYTVSVDGWILSRTEARLCALSS